MPLAVAVVTFDKFTGLVTVVRVTVGGTVSLLAESVVWVVLPAASVAVTV